MGNSLVTFLGNVAVDNGGAINSATGCIKLTQNSKVIFSDNTAGK